MTRLHRDGTRSAKYPCPFRETSVPSLRALPLEGGEVSKAAMLGPGRWRPREADPRARGRGPPEWVGASQSLDRHDRRPPRATALANERLRRCPLGNWRLARSSPRAQGGFVGSCARRRLGDHHVPFAVVLPHSVAGHLRTFLAGQVSFDRGPTDGKGRRSRRRSHGETVDSCAPLSAVNHATWVTWTYKLGAQG